MSVSVSPSVAPSDLDIIHALEAALGSAGGVLDPSLAFNINNSPSHMTQMMFLDISKTMRDWRGQTGEGWAKADELDEMGALDDRGWVTHLPEGIEFVDFRCIWDNDGAETQARRAGVYVMRWEGEGEVELRGDARLISAGDGRIVFETSGKDWRFLLSDIDPEGAGDYFRDLSIVKQEHVDLFDAGAIFNPDYIEKIADARLLRFMNAGEINNSVVRDWDERARLDDARWDHQGVPIEVMVRMANEAGADAWFNIPVAASDDYIRQFAEYVRDHLDPALTATVEFGNENWNFSFNHFQQLNRMALADWGDEAGGNLGFHYAAKRATETALIWDEVFAGREDAPALVNVLGVQGHNPGLTTLLLNADRWAQMEPDGFVSPVEVFDAITVAPYFGGQVLSTEDSRAQLIAKMTELGIDTDGAPDARWEEGYAWLAEKLMDPTFRGSVPDSMSYVRAQAELAEAYGLDIVAYEGGSHLHHLFGVKGEAVADALYAGEFLHQFSRSAHMAELYAEMWQTWSEIGDGPFMQFGAVGESSKWGSWTLWESLDDVTPRADLVMEMNAATPGWWGDDASDGAHLQGVTRTGTDGDDLLVGTTQEDFLSGGAGNDVFVVGLGEDRVHGGEGDDTLVMAGAETDYARTEDAEGRAMLVGAGSAVTLVSIERIRFAAADLTGGSAGSDGSAASGEAYAQPNPQFSAGPEIAIGVEGRAEVIVVEGDAVEAAADAGLRVRAVEHSPLARELADEARPVHSIALRDGTAIFDGVEVAVSRWSTQHNQAAQDGEALAESAHAAATELGALVYGAGSIAGGAGADDFWGGASDEFFFGAGGNDILCGGAGDDVLQGGAGSDLIFGGAGADLIVFEAGDGADRIRGFEARDSLDLTGLGLGEGASLADHAGEDAMGRLVLDFGGGDSLTFQGIGLADLEGIHALL